MKKITEKITNYCLVIFSYLRYFLKIGSKKSPHTSQIVFQDTFESFDKNSWRIGQPWGDFHPGALYQYYGRPEEGFVQLHPEGLRLLQRYQPKKFYNIDREISIPHGVGLVVSKKYFKYGYFECEAKLPKGVGLWPAIWLSDYKTWPPEIDILEGYSNDRGKYKSKLETNIHYGVEVNKMSSGASKHILRNPDKSYHKYGVSWTQNSIKFYYDGWLVRVVTDKKILDWLNKTDVYMLWILNNAIRPEFVKSAPDQSEFLVKKVSVCAFLESRFKSIDSVDI